MPSSTGSNVRAGKGSGVAKRISKTLEHLWNEESVKGIRAGSLVWGRTTGMVHVLWYLVEPWEHP